VVTGSTPARGHGHLFRPKVIQGAASDYQDLMLVIPNACPQPIAEPNEPARVGLHELVIQQKRALKLACESQPNERGELSARADRKRRRVTLGSLGRAPPQAK